MSVRVLTITGKIPVILMVPYGPEHINTGVIAETCANTLHCSAIINQGFLKPAPGTDKVNVNKDQADCNQIDHALQPVVYDEYLQPMLKIKDRICQKIRSGLWSNLENVAFADLPKCMILYVLGAPYNIHNELGPSPTNSVGMIVGWGAGAKHDSPTCTLWKKDCFLFYAQNYFNGLVCEGKGTGRYSGRASDCMNQYFVRKQPERLVDSLQIYFPLSSRETPGRADEQGIKLALALNRVLKVKTSKDFHETVRVRSI